LLPALIFVFVRINVVQLAFAMVFLSKWRMFAVKPRHWPANVRANGIDLLVGISTVIFMMHSGTQLWQLIWALAYGLWLIFIKPGSSVFMISLQALIGQLAGLMALFLAFGSTPIYVLVLLSWMICYAAARHFFTSFEESLTRFLSYLWAYFAAALVWILSHWLLFYGVISQPTLILSVLSFGLASLYYLEKQDRLTILLRRQIVFVMIAVVIIVIAFSNWGDKTI
ncbi:MAG: hypothetical protein JWS12_170, partial [Candidatus Saccharibacteria bacterium]|nr:hypothetical protein [Candidatus Saccharibacteria bacterium]